MVLPIVLGTIAQGDADGSESSGSAPTGVSIATGSSGNHNNAFSSTSGNTGSGSGVSLDWDGSGLSVPVYLTVGGNPGPYTVDYSNQPTADGIVEAYLRATDATSYSMQGSIASYQSVLNVTWVGNAFTSQDGTGSGGIGYFQITQQVGRGGVTLPSVGDWIRVQISGSATNSNGTTNATNVIIIYTFTAG